MFVVSFVMARILALLLDENTMFDVRIDPSVLEARLGLSSGSGRIHLATLADGGVLRRLIGDDPEYRVVGTTVLLQDQSVQVELDLTEQEERYRLLHSATIGEWQQSRATARATAPRDDDILARLDDLESGLRKALAAVQSIRRGLAQTREVSGALSQ